MTFVSLLFTFFLICSVLFWGYSGRRGVGRSLRSLAGWFEARAYAGLAPVTVTIDDVSRLNQTDVSEIVCVHSVDDVKAALERARELGKHVSISGRRHSMGGQSFDRGNIVLDMLGFSQMSFDPQTRILTVQSGAAWKDVQKYLDPLGQSVKIMQSDNIFSVGGTVSVNAHGWTPRHPPIASTVQGFRIMLASGEIQSC